MCRAKLNSQRSNRLAQLDEAIGISKSFAVKKPSTLFYLGDMSRDRTLNVVRCCSVNLTISQALELGRLPRSCNCSSPIARLKFSIVAKMKVGFLRGGGQSLRAEEARLRSLNVDMTRLKLVAIGQQALESLSPIKQRRILIFAFGVFPGWRG